MYADDNILYFSEDSCNFAFSCNEMVILNIDLINSDEDDPDTIILIRLLPWHINFEKRTALKKDKERPNANSMAS